MGAGLVIFGGSNTNGYIRTIFDSSRSYTYADVIAGAVRRNPSVGAKCGCTSPSVLVFNEKFTNTTWIRRIFR